MGHKIIATYNAFSALPGDFTAAITGNAPTVSFPGGGILRIDGVANGHMRQQLKIAGSNVPNVEMEVRFKTGTNLTSAGQLFWTGCFTTGASINGVGFLHASDQSPKDRMTRRETVTSASNGSVSGILNNGGLGTNSTLATSTFYRRFFRRTGSGGSRTYSVFTHDDSGNLVASSTSNSGVQSDADTDAADNYMTIGAAAATEISEVILRRIDSPNFTGMPSPTTVNEGSPASFSATVLNGDAGSDPGTTNNLGLQWEYSDDGGTTPADYTLGTGSATNSLTTANTILSQSGRVFRLRATDTVNGQVHYSDWATLTVAPAGPPAPSPGSTNTGGTTITIPFTKDLTLNDNNPANWPVQKNGATSVGVTSVAVQNNDEILLTLSGRIKDSDTVTVGFLGGANVLEGPDDADVVAFSNLSVTNLSNVDFSVSIPAPYDESAVERGFGYIKIRVAITRANDTDSLTLSCPGLDPKLNAAFTHPGTGNVGYVDLSADADADLDLVGSAVTITATDAYGDARSDFTNLKVFENLDTVPPDNTFTTVFLSSSTGLYMLLAGAFTLREDLFAAPNAVTYLDLVENAGAHTIGSSATADWLPGALSGPRPGVLHEAVCWGKANGVRIAEIIVPYSNDVAVNNLQWADVDEESTEILTYLKRNFRKTLVYPATGRFNQTATVSGTVTAVNGDRTVVTVSVSVGTLDAGELGDYLLLPRSDGKRSVELITGVSGNDITLAAALPAEALTNSTFTITPDTWTTRIAACNGSGPTSGVQTLCEGGNAAIGGAGGVIRYKETNALQTVKIFETDNIHLAPAPALVLGADMRDDHLAPELLENATLDLTVDDNTIEPLGTAQLTPVVDLSEYGFDACPGGLLYGNGSTFDIDSGDAVVDTDGTVTAGGTPSTVVARFDLGFVPFGGLPLSGTVNINVSAGGGDTDPPVATASILADGVTLRVITSEATSGTAGVSVAVDGISRAISGASRVSGTTIDYTLAQEVTNGPEQTVTYSYDPAVGNILDSASNELPAFSGTAVVNASERRGRIRWRAKHPRRTGKSRLL